MITPLFRLLIRIWQAFLRPIAGPNCRFTPSCSDYALEALTRHGAGRGTLLAIWRIIRCNPWDEGGYDPVPEHHGRCACQTNRTKVG